MKALNTLTKEQKQALRIMKKDYHNTSDEFGLFSKCGNWKWKGFEYVKSIELDGHKYTAHVIWWGQVFFFIDYNCLIERQFPVGKMKDQLDYFNMFFEKLVKP